MKSRRSFCVRQSLGSVVQGGGKMVKIDGLGQKREGAGIAENPV